MTTGSSRIMPLPCIDAGKTLDTNSSNELGHAKVLKTIKMCFLSLAYCEERTKDILKSIFRLQPDT
jgi:hypothetical protein